MYMTRPDHRTSKHIATLLIFLMLFGGNSSLILARSNGAAVPRAIPVPRGLASGGTDSSKHSTKGYTAAAATTPAASLPGPVITATNVDAWDDTATPDGKAEPGRTVTYTVTVTNNGTDATGVV